MSVRVDLTKMPAHVRDSAYFVSKETSSAGKGRKRSTESTGIVPLSFPATRAVLWSRSPTGAPATLHLTHYRNCRVLVLEKTLRLAQRHAVQTEDRPFTGFLIGSAVVDSDEEGVSVTLDRFDPGRRVPGRTERIPTASLLGDHVVQTTITMTKRAPRVEDSVTNTKDSFASTFKSLHHNCCTKDPVDVSNFLAIQAHIYVQDEGDAMTFDIHLSAVSMATSFEATPVTPVPIIPTALARNLAGPLNLSKVQGVPKSGFLTMDQTRKLLLLLESDPKIYSLPLVGIWVCGPVNIHSPHIWACCLRYMYNTNIQDRVYTPMQGFLVVLYSPTHSQPEFYDCRTKDGVMNFHLYNCFETLHILKDSETIDKRPLQLELVPAQDGQNFGLFQQALKDIEPIECPTGMSPTSAMKRMFPGEDSSHGNNHQDSPVPRPSPSPHPLSGKSPVVQPLVPELSMVFDSFCEILPQNVNKLNDSLLDKENQTVSRENPGGKHVHFAPANSASPKGVSSPHTHASPQGRQPLRNYNYQTPPQDSSHPEQKQHSSGKHAQAKQSVNSKQGSFRQPHDVQTYHQSNAQQGFVSRETHRQGNNRQGVLYHPHEAPSWQNGATQRHPGPATTTAGYAPSAANPHLLQQQQRFPLQPDNSRHPPRLPAGPRHQFQPLGPRNVPPYRHPVGSTQAWGNGQIPQPGPPRQDMGPIHRQPSHPYHNMHPPYLPQMHPTPPQNQWQPRPPAYPPQQAWQPPPNHHPPPNPQPFQTEAHPYGVQTHQIAHQPHGGIMKNQQQLPGKSKRAKNRSSSHGTPPEGHHHGNRHPPQAVHFTPSPHQVDCSNSANQQSDGSDEPLSPANQSEGYHSALEQSELAANQEESSVHAQSGMSPDAYKLLMQQDAQLKMLMAQIQRLLGAQPTSTSEHGGEALPFIPSTVNQETPPTKTTPSTTHQQSQGTQSNGDNCSGEEDETTKSLPDAPENADTEKRTASIAINTGTSLYWSDPGLKVTSAEGANEEASQVSCDIPNSAVETGPHVTLPKSPDQEIANERSECSSHDLEGTNDQGSFGMELSQLPVEPEAGHHASMVSSLQAVDIESYAGSTPTRSPLDSETNQQTSMGHLFQSPVLGESASMCVQSQTEGVEEEEERSNNPTSFRDEEHFYQQILGQVNQLLHNSSKDSEGPQSEPRLSLPGHPPTSPPPKPRRLSESALWEKEHQRVVKATRRQLKRMGTVVEEHQVSRRDVKQHTDHQRPTSVLPSADFIPKINYISLSEMALESTDLSFEANAIAMKYLSDDQLANLPITPAHHGNQAPSRMRAIGANQSLMRGMFRGRGMNSRMNFEVTPVNMSMATWKYMQRYGLIEEEDEETSQVFSPPKQVTSNQTYSSSESDEDEEQHASTNAQSRGRALEEPVQGRGRKGSKECSCCSGSSHGSGNRSGRQKDRVENGEEPIVVFPDKWKGGPRRQSFEDEERRTRSSSEISDHREGEEREAGSGRNESGKSRNILDLGKLRQMPKLL